jgi:hypothetical protein
VQRPLLRARQHQVRLLRVTSNGHTHISMHQHTTQAQTLGKNKHQPVALLAASFIQAVLDRGCLTAKTAVLEPHILGLGSRVQTHSTQPYRTWVAEKQQAVGWPVLSRTYCGPPA